MIQETIIIKNTLSHIGKDCGLYMECRIGKMHAIKLSQESFMYMLIDDKRFIIKNVYTRKGFVTEVYKLIN